MINEEKLLNTSGISDGNTVIFKKWGISLLIRFDNKSWIPPSFKIDVTDQKDLRGSISVEFVFTSNMYQELERRFSKIFTVIPTDQKQLIFIKIDELAKKIINADRTVKANHMESAKHEINEWIVDFGDKNQE